MNIVMPVHIALTDDAYAKISALPTQIYDEIHASEHAVIERVRDAEIIIAANYAPITARVIDAAPHLKYIIVPAVGYDWVDYRYASEKGVQIINCPTYNSEAVAEHVIGLMFAVARKLLVADASIERHRWQPKHFEGTEIRGKKMGIVGFGNIGKRVGKMALGLGMHVSHVNSSSGAKAIDDLMATSDVVVLCLPLTEQTKGMIDARRLGLMQPDAILINVARGEIADRAALIKCLKAGSIAGAGLDVFADEPIRSRVPESIVEIASLPNVVATPHIAYHTVEAIDRLGDELYKNLLACIEGSPINVVNPVHVSSYHNLHNAHHELV